MADYKAASQIPTDDNPFMHGDGDGDVDDDENDLIWFDFDAETIQRIGEREGFLFACCGLCDNQGDQISMRAFAKNRTLKLNTRTNVLTYWKGANAVECCRCCCCYRPCTAAPCRFVPEKAVSLNVLGIHSVAVEPGFNPCCDCCFGCNGSACCIFTFNPLTTVKIGTWNSPSTSQGQVNPEMVIYGLKNVEFLAKTLAERKPPTKDGSALAAGIYHGLKRAVMHRG